MKYGLQFRDVFAAWESILDGVWITLLLSALAMIGGFVIGVACAAARVYGPAWLRRIWARYDRTAGMPHATPAATAHAAREA